MTIGSQKGEKLTQCWHGHTEQSKEVGKFQDKNTCPMLTILTESPEPRPQYLVLKISTTNGERFAPFSLVNDHSGLPSESLISCMTSLLVKYDWGTGTFSMTEPECTTTRCGSVE